MTCKFNRPFFISLSTTRRQGNALPFGRFSPCKYLLLLILLFSQALVSPVNAEWGRTADDYIRLPLYRDAHICSDGNGGCWATGEGVGLSHVDRNGNLTWGMEPFFLQPGYGYNPRPVLADNGDVIVGMNINNEDDGLTNVYLQRANLDQELLWGDDGIQLDTSSRYEALSGIYKGPLDDTYLIHWVRHDGDYRNYDVRLQLINGNAESQWGVGGIGLDWLHSNTHFVTTSDHCIIAAQNVSPTPTVAVVKVSAEGDQLWDSRFSILWEDLKRRDIDDIESDREDGVILTYEYERYENIDDSIKYYGINVVRISSNGDSLWTRQVYERERYPDQADPFRNCESIINYAGSECFFVAWADYPNSFQVVALNIDGEFIWDEPVDIITTPIGAGLLDGVDSHDGVCYVWDEAAEREEGWRLQQWGQRINANGERMWGDRGRAIQARNDNGHSITTDGNGGVITVIKTGPTVQMINRNGEIGVVLAVSVDEDIDKPKSSKMPPQLFIYPNPGNSQFIIKYDTGVPGETFSYGIYNLMGRVIKSGMMMGEHYIINDLSRFSSGEYILLLQSPRTTVSTRFSLIK